MRCFSEEGAGSLSSLYDQGYEIRLRDMLPSYRGPGKEDLLSRPDLGQRLIGIHVFCQVVVCKMAILLKLTEDSSHGPQDGYYSGIFAGEGRVPQVQNAIGSSLH